MFIAPPPFWAPWPGEPEPLFEQDYRDANFEMAFPTTAAWFTDQGLLAPDHIWTFEESSGDILDHIGSYDLSPVVEANTLRARTAYGIPYNEGWDQKKCLEFRFDTADYFELADAAYLDATESLTFYVVVRSYYKGVDEANDGNSIYYSIFNKYADEGSGPRGYGLMSGGAVPRDDLHWRIARLGSDGGLRIDDGLRWTQWCGAMFGVDYAADEAWEWHKNESSSGLGGNSISTPNTKFRLGFRIDGAFGGSRADTALCQIAYLCCWKGANAETVHNTFAARPYTYYRALYGGEQLYQNNPGGYATWVNAGCQGKGGIVQNIDTNAPLLRETPHWQPPLHSSPDFSHATKSGALSGQPDPSVATTAWFTETDTFSDAAWTKNNVTVGTANADLDDGPSGFRDAMKLSATVNNANLTIPASTGPGPGFASFFYKRHSGMGSNVTGLFRLYNTVTASYEFSEAFTATDEWQWMEVRVTPANDACRLEVWIDNSGDDLCIYRVVGNLYMPSLERKQKDEATAYQYGVMPAVEDWLKSAQGEIEVVFCGRRATVDANETPFDVGQDGSISNVDSRVLVYDGAAQLDGQVFDNGGGLDHTINGLTEADWYNTEHVVIFQWDHDSASLNGRHSRLIIDGVEYLGAAAGWTIDGTVLDKIWIGAANRGLASYTANVLIARVRVWEEPWQYL